MDDADTCPVCQTVFAASLVHRRVVQGHQRHQHRQRVVLSSEQPAALVRPLRRVRA